MPMSNNLLTSKLVKPEIKKPISDRFSGTVQKINEEVLNKFFEILPEYLEIMPGYADRGHCGC